MEGAAAAKCGRGLHGYGLAAWGVPLGGADGYGCQQAGVQGGQTLASGLPAPLPADGHGWAGGGLKGGLTNFLQSAHSRKPTRLCRGHGGCGRCKVRPRPPWVRLSRMGRPPWGADGYGRQQAGVQGGQTLAAALPVPLPADGHGWAGGDSREGSLTSCIEP